MKFGVGKYRLIEETRLLPGKNDQQLSGQTQRLLGQQSLAGACLAAPSPGPAVCYSCAARLQVRVPSRTPLGPGRKFALALDALIICRLCST